MPVKNLFQKYFSDFKDYDEVLKSDMSINPNWTKLLTNFAQIGADDLAEKQNQIDWLLAENGVTYNVYNDPKGLNRPWNLNIIPFIIEQKEWKGIEKGLQQRAELLNLILTDIYGKRELIKNKIVPPEIIYAHRGFLRNCDQIKYNTSKNLLIHSADLARGPDGRMWVVNDRSEAPSGMGYALENRFSIRRTVPNLFNHINVEQPSSYFKDFHQLLIDAATNSKENPTIVILTPGPHNETYFEHAYLSSFLGYPLVKGYDLIVRDNKVFLKTLKGLIQVDVVLRRVDGAYTDPLELKGDSYLGVAGLLNVVRKQNVSILNPIGSGVLENPGLIPFMNSICKYFLKEDLILPQIASWWCGQEKERNFVLENLEKFVVKPIDRTNREHIYFCEVMSKKELTALKKQILSRPYHYVAQEKISFSTAPNFHNNSLEPRKVVCRTFSVAKKDAYSVMPGGLVRVASEKEELRVSNQRGGTSKDFWITNSDSQEQSYNKRFHWHPSTSNSFSSIENLPSNIAENLFWSGRYLARTLVTARYTRMVLNKMVDVQFSKLDADAKSLDILFQSITHLTSVFPGFTGENKKKALKDPLTEISIILFDNNKVGSLANSISSFSNSYYSLRNLWSKDMWRVFESMRKEWNDFKPENRKKIKSLVKLLDSIITKLIAFIGLIEESILVEQGLLLYFIGLQMEFSMMTIDKSRALLVVKHEEDVEYEILESLLDSHESLNIYRYSFKSYLNLENTINLILLDKSYARSLKYQLNRIKKDISKLPEKNIPIELTNSYLQISKACDLIENTNSLKLVSTRNEQYTRANLDTLLADLSSLIHDTTVSITDTYFNHSDQQRQLVHQKDTW
ncbi:circularly permuted type 2 ATP-grasp protein [Polaribacter litorisediminis]|uniref:circularly permuted type 2 ATP-grasp protein n=1 Tax=Polaribacter litorisediminis TaxID=1908341 RepID=UPI001CBC08DA|nr:circularly permuted type 2 ATP-grasp protein [Polaribacter litorisediminis]UAM99410.1 circularly permuted type 2 ATP-grasp protein [Polaribacter litorisediminis]